MITRLAHVCIYAEDLAETEKFYIEIPGWEKGFEFLKDQAQFGFYIKLGNDTFIEVFKGDPGTAGKIDHLSIETNDIDQVISTLRSNGFDATGKKLRVDQSWQPWTKDPSGVKIELHQYTGESLQFSGGACEVDW